MITSNKINTIQRKIKEAIKEIEKEENVKISFGTCRYSQADYKTTMKVVTTAKDENTVKAVDNVNENLSKSYGFKENIIGKRFVGRNGVVHEIIEFKTRNRKYPIITESQGRRYKHTTASIRSYING